MGIYANQLKRKYRTFREDRLMEFLKKTFKTQDAINAAMLEMRGPRSWKVLDTTPLTKEEQKTLFECAKQTSWVQMRPLMGLKEKSNASVATYRFAQYALKYFHNLK